jgi:hypothetical protein
MVHAFKYTSMVTAVQKIRRCRSIMVSCRYECMPGCARMRMYAYCMLLCMCHAVVQIKSVSSSVPALALTQQASSCASCARFDSPKEDRTDRMGAAERMTHVRGVPVEPLLLHPLPSLARSDRTTPCSRRSSGSDASRHRRQSHKYSMRSEYHWQSSHLPPLPLLLISFIFLPRYAGRYVRFLPFAYRPSTV